MTSSLELSPFCWVPAALEFNLVRWVHVEICWWEFAVPVLRSLPVNWASTTIGWMSIRCIPIAIGFPFVHHVLIAIGVFPIHYEVGAHLFSIVSFFLLTDARLFSCWLDQSSDDSPCNKAGEYEPRASRDSMVVDMLIMRLVPWEIRS